MSLEKEIIRIIKSSINGIKARDIAHKLDLDSSEVNRKLYNELSNQVEQDDDYKWHIKKTEVKSDTTAKRQEELISDDINLSIREKLEKARKELLDLGLRNHLINYKELTTKGIHVLDEISKQLLNILVKESKTMYFLPDPSKDRNGEGEEGQSYFDFIQPDESDDEIADRHTDNKIQTPHSSKRLQRRLLNTYYQTRSHIQERGVNVLYLALGMLHWYEDENSDKLRRAPLILIPIELSRSDAQSKFKIRYTGEEIGGNLSLQAKFKMDFGLEIPLPEIGEELSVHELNLEKYFESVAHKIRNRDRWKVAQNEQGIGFFSFNKFLMYNDLDHKNWPDGKKPSQHPIINSLMGEGFDEPEPIITNNDHIDDYLEPKDLNQVVNADSSQTKAISDVIQGRNLVIQGPPGTGKSQTITNIIAEALADNKKVLFVSEKMAALEVVKRRMDEIRLGDACLELHSHKSNKKSFLDELERTMNLNKPINNNNDFDIEGLKKNRDELNRYSSAVNEAMGESHATPYQAYGRILKIKKELGEVSKPKIGQDKLLGLDRANFKKILDSVERLEAQIERIGRPIEHPFWGSNLKVYIPSHDEEIKEDLENILDNLDELRKRQEKLSCEFDLDLNFNWDEANNVIEIANFALNAPKDLHKVDLKNELWIRDQESIDRLIQIGKRISELKKQYGSQLINEAWEEEVLDIRKTLVAKGDKWWKIFSRDYWKAKNDLAGIMAEKLPKELEKQLDLVGAILEYQRLAPRIEDNEELGNELFQRLYKGEDTDWKNLEDINDWLLSVHERNDEKELLKKILVYFSSPIDKEEIHSKKVALEKYRNNYKYSIEQLFERIDFEEEIRFKDESFFEQNYSIHEKIFEEQLNNIEKLSEITSLNHNLNELKEHGFEDYAQTACEWKPAGKYLSELFELNWLESHLEKTLSERDELAGFSSEAHWEKIKKFRDLDEQLLRHNRAEIAYKHWDNLPKRIGIGAVGGLIKEFNKKRRHKPIRQLMKDSGSAIQDIKLVFMMSPLSVSTYIPPDSVEFDLVIFDEASQVRPVDALSPLLRAKQAIVVGDSKQLPPTSFFEVELELEDDEEQAEAGDMESILGLFEGKGAPSSMLRWHYRSEHESLIAVSNYEFYNNDLVLFPSPDVEKKNTGIKYHHLKYTYYEPGKGKSINRGEAKKVARAVLEHAEEKPELSLGVAAFSKSQMEAIQDELEILRREDSSYESFFNVHPDEPFFVKNLENVQGDERDIIFISIGYGKTEDGYVSMNFGPINHDGGERRLNVLITRARKRCEIFTNLLAQDIDTSRTQAKGMVALKRYLKYARTGELDLPQSTEREADSEFEEDVGHELRQYGYEIEYQVGSAGFLIDLGVRSEENPSEFILGIECDGASYHSARSARDRDRIRQDVLERIGWNIHRVWSTDWFKNKEKEVSKLLQEIERLSLGKEPEKKGDDSSRDIKKNSSFTRVLETGSNDNSLSVPYQETEIGSVKNLKNSYKDRYGQNCTYEALVDKIAEAEGPIHQRILMKKIADLLGYGRLGRKIRQNISTAIRNTTDQDFIKRNGDFVYHKYSDLQIRDRSNLSSEYRAIDHIAPEEIQRAIMILVEKSYGSEIEDLVKEVGSLLGYSRVTQNIFDSIKEQVNTLLKEEKLQINGTQLSKG
mgnify:CR=1 FL=1